MQSRHGHWLPTAAQAELEMWLEPGTHAAIQDHLYVHYAAQIEIRADQ